MLQGEEIWGEDAPSASNYQAFNGTLTTPDAQNQKAYKAINTPTFSSSSSSYSPSTTKHSTLNSYPTSAAFKLLLSKTSDYPQAIKMHMTKVFAFATILAAGALAAPAAEANPPKPTPPQNPPQPTQTTVNQSNACGNNATPYCCNTDNKGKYTTCYAFRKLSRVRLLLHLFHGSLSSSHLEDHQHG